MKKVTLKVAQNGGEYYGYAIVKNIPDESEIIKTNTTIGIGNMEIEFDEHIEIVRVESV